MAPVSTRTRMKLQKQQEAMARDQCAIKEEVMSKKRVFEEVEDVSSCSRDCSTPKAKRFRIPEVLTCPPAPKKRRVNPPCSSINRSPIALFASPDIELFFFSALKNVSV